MERLKLFVFALVIIFLNASAFAQETAPDSVRVGIVIDGPSVFGRSLLTFVKAGRVKQFAGDQAGTGADKN